MVRTLSRILYAVFLTSLCAFLAQPVLAQPPLKIGEPVPAFSLPGIDGKLVSLPVGTNVPAVVVHFWSGSCRSCLKEMPEVEALYQKYKGKDLVVYAVNVGDSKSNVKVFAERLKITFPVLQDSDGEIARQYGVVGVPRTYFVDRNGLLRNKLLGEAPARILDRLIQTIM
jgi:cytochrome c biogenesis protein CcmG, thiol:disulfide interchange protein DsbE